MTTTQRSRNVTRIATTAAIALWATSALAQAAAPHYFGPYANYANSPLPAVDATTGAITGGLRKFVDGLPGVGPAGANNLGQYIPVAAADPSAYAGSDYYEIALVQYRMKFHTDLPPSMLRGYVQLSTAAVPGKHVPLTNPDGSPILLPDGTQAYGVDDPHYLGPAILATKDRPVRVLFRNLLPTGAGGNLFIPVDTTVMGAGNGPDRAMMPDADPRDPDCGKLPKPAGCYTENRATLHLHGGTTPWISDGTPHQWTTPAGENTLYPRGVSVRNVPDMPDPGPGAITFFYTNQQSARLLFYHDHAWGITRLNVYAGEAAPYLITDPAEQRLLAQGLLPADQIPLVIQDKTFVPATAQLLAQDPTWDVARWGGEGSIWVPHVYMPAQNPGDSSGVNQFGRWAYGPWFWPPTSLIEFPPLDNPYFDPACDPDVAGFCEPPTIPGVPYLSMGMESFNDTPIVNGTAYPTTTVQPKAYRFRILNAANDRFFNLSLYVADASGKEVALNAAEVAAAKDDPTIFPTPDTAASPPGPSWVQVATEGGFLPMPVTVPPQPTTWVTDPTVFNAGNVDKHSLLLGPAERADVVVDFSAFAGRTLILYNDAPAAFPARDPRYDYYTDNADLSSTGGAPTTLPGYGPNTRTVMQIVVANEAPAAAFDVAALTSAFAHHLDPSGVATGVFETSQEKIVVGQGAYNAALGTAFRNSAPRDGFARIYDFSLSFDTVDGTTVTMPLQPKAIQDEMGEAFDMRYGRMSGNLGLEAPSAAAGAQNLLLYAFTDPPTEIVKHSDPSGAAVRDGTQLWKITHNGVDTHPIHFHMFDVQLVNRVGWDGIIRKPDASELGWKDTVRVSPLEDTIVALRPHVPNVPFDLPNSIRLMDPSMPQGATLSTPAKMTFDPLGNPIDPIINHYVNYGHEFVWHCHILSHEEMDMMRSIVVAKAPAAPTALAVTRTGSGNNRTVNLTWTDASVNETSFAVLRATAATGPWTTLATVASDLTSGPGTGPRTYVDRIGNTNTQFWYQVVAVNTVGDTWDYTANGGVGFPTETLTAASPVATWTATVTPPAAPTSAVATLQAGPQISFTFRDNATNETGFVVERSVNGGAFTLVQNLPARTSTGSVTWVDTAVTVGSSYRYRVAAVNAGGTSAYATSGTVTVPVPPPPAAPTNAVATLQAGPQISLTFRDNATNETGFVVERSVNGGAFALVQNLPARTTTGNVTWVDTAVTPGSSYQYRVAAVNGNGTSAYATSATVTVPAAPAVPAAPTLQSVTAAVVNATTDQVTLTWTDVAGETSYTIQGATDAAFTTGVASITNLPANTPTYAAQVPRGAGIRYYLRVRGENAAGAGAWSNAMSVVLP
jgi:FtsP/CotA-like multicopper oxidase with cupredoxin domain